jgi:hypothetical protein
MGARPARAQAKSRVLSLAPDFVSAGQPPGAAPVTAFYCRARTPWFQWSRRNSQRRTTSNVCCRAFLNSSLEIKSIHRILADGFSSEGSNRFRPARSARHNGQSTTCFWTRTSFRHWSKSNAKVIVEFGVRSLGRCSIMPQISLLTGLSRRFRLDLGSGKCVYDAAPDTSPPPADEPVVASGVWAKRRRQITPGCLIGGPRRCH